MKFKPYDPHEPKDSSRMILAIIVSLLILFGFHHLYEKPRIEALEQARSTSATAPAALDVAQAPTRQQAEHALAVASAPTEKATAPRLEIRGEKVFGSISLAGLRLDELYLTDYYETIERENKVKLLAPAGEEKAYYIESGWLADRQEVAVPNASSLWQFAPGSPRVLEGSSQVTLQWNNGQGLIFERTIALDDQYLFTITQRVLNQGAATVTLYPYHLISRHSLPRDYTGMFVQHEGPIGYLEQDLQEPSYKDLRKGKNLSYEGVGGWAGFTDKYWLVSLIPDPNEKVRTRFVGAPKNDKEFYQADIMGAAVSIGPGQSAENTTHLFAGAKVLKTLKAYRDQLNVPNFDLALDFGMWYMLTKPLFVALVWLGEYFGHIGIGILVLTVLLRLAVFPLTNKSFKSMAGMKRITPQLKEIQEKYKDNPDRAKLQQEIMSLYQREKVNPFSGCWPMLVQIPIFFALYKVILISIELRHAPFWGWINDLSAPDPTSMFNLFGLIPWDPPQLLTIGGWPILFCLTMIAQKRLSPPMPDPVQERIQTLFPYFITLMLAHFAAGLVIYWTWSNFLGILQQYFILRTSGNDVHLIKGHAERRRAKSDKKGKKSKKDKK